MDTLEQVELIDLGDQDAADVFLPCEDPPPTPQTSGMPLCFGPVGTGRSELDVKAGLGKSAQRGWAWSFPPRKHLLVLILGKLTLGEAGLQSPNPNPSEGPTALVFINFSFVKSV